MTQAHRIADKQPVFPCWLWIPNRALYPSGGFWSPTLYRKTWLEGMKMATHWHPDAPTPPPLTPDASTTGKGACINEDEGGCSNKKCAEVGHCIAFANKLASFEHQGVREAAIKLAGLPAAYATKRETPPPPAQGAEGRTPETTSDFEKLLAIAISVGELADTDTGYIADLAAGHYQPRITFLETELASARAELAEAKAELARLDKFMPAVAKSQRDGWATADELEKENDALRAQVEEARKDGERLFATSEAFYVHLMDMKNWPMKDIPDAIFQPWNDALRAMSARSAAKEAT